jgi:isoquinoline 1-oxidoreductase subunit beta
MMSRIFDRPLAGLSRRQVMTGAAGLTFAFAIDRRGTAAAAALEGEATGISLSPWVSIARNGMISIMSPAAETGQGSMTSLPLILAEELDADWEQVRIVPAPVIEKIYGNPAFGGAMFTAGSTAVSAYFTPLRTFGAQVRLVLLDNVSRRWKVPIEELTTEPSTVVHASSGRKLGYGEIAAFAVIPATAPEIKPGQLKKTSEFRLIGKDVMRVELPSKVDGTAAYSIDVQIPGMIYGTVLEKPRRGR